ncbi:MAG: M20 family peptidase [Candidatus Atribacteria bacterium]|nr:MAG: M20 family peptidase [Candidatus Atribacteria bacterium]
MNDNKILKKVSDDELYEIASDLVKIPSYTGLENQEKKVADYICEFFKKEKIEVKSYKVLEGRPNIVAIIRGTGKGKSLMLSGHMDTVPPYKMKINPFSGEIKNEKLYGRGSCDMKGALACMMSAMAAIKKSGEKL